MAESGCIKDLSCQNLVVLGNTKISNNKPMTNQKKNILTVTGAATSPAATLVLKESQSNSVVLVNNTNGGNGNNVQITLPLLGDDSTATTITPGLVYEIIVTHAPGHAGALLEISTGDDAVNMNIFSSLLGTAHNDGTDQVLSGPGVRGTLAHSKLILTPDTTAEALNTRIVCRSITSTIWDVRAEEPAAAVSNLTSAAAAAFA